MRGAGDPVGPGRDCLATPPFTIRSADLAQDLDAILGIDAATFVNPTRRESYEWEAQHSDVARIWVVSDTAGTVVGYCAAWLIFDELHINNLAVHPDCRRRGAAALLLAAVLAAAEAAGAERATLEVRRSNEAAQRLYARFGFVVAAERPRYYREPVEDALILWRGPPRAEGPVA